MANLRIIGPEKHWPAFTLAGQEACLIGRDAAADILLEEPIVSSRHARIIPQGEAFLLVDLNSENGTYVNSKRIKSLWLNDGDVITIGRHMMTFANPVEAAASYKWNRTVHETIAIKGLEFDIGRDTAVLDDADSPAETLMLVQLPQCKKAIHLSNLPVTFGRADTSDIVIKQFGVGKRAGVIEKLPDGWYFKYAGGFVKPKLNGESVTECRKLKPFDMINFGRTRIAVIPSRKK